MLVLVFFDGLAISSFPFLMDFLMVTVEEVESGNKENLQVKGNVV